MAGGSHPKSSASHRKSRWESSAAAANNPSSESEVNDKKPAKPAANSNSSPKPSRGPSPPPTSTTTPSDPVCALPGPSFPWTDLLPPPPPTYGFHMLERRTIVLPDGNVCSYFALPPDYQDFPPRPPLPPRFHTLGPSVDFPSAVSGLRFPPVTPEGLGLLDNNQNHNPSMKRKHGGDEEEFRFGNKPNGLSRRPGNRGEFLAGTSSPSRRNLVDDSRAGKYMRIAGTA